MVKFYNYLNEDIDENDYIINLLNSDFKEAFKRHQKGYYIGRATRDIGKYDIVHRSTIRKSANTSNYYTLIINNHKSGKEFPKRQVICAGGSGRRAFIHGGKIYVVLPENGAKIGICPEDDIGESFEKLKKIGILRLNTFNSIFQMNYLFLDDNQKGIFISDENGQSFRKESKGIKISDVIEVLETFVFYNPTITSSDELKIIKHFKNNKNKTLYDWAVDMLNPQDNGFDIQKISNYSVDKSSDFEVGTDSKCLLIESALLKNIIKGM